MSSVSVRLEIFHSFKQCFLLRLLLLQFRGCQLPFVQGVQLLHRFQRCCRQAERRNAGCRSMNSRQFGYFWNDPERSGRFWNADSQKWSKCRERCTPSSEGWQPQERVEGERRQRGRIRSLHWKSCSKYILWTGCILMGHSQKLCSSICEESIWWEGRLFQGHLDTSKCRRRWTNILHVRGWTSRTGRGRKLLGQERWKRQQSCRRCIWQSNTVEFWNS